MKLFSTFFLFLFGSLSILNGQCTLEADDYTVEIEISAIDLLTTQNGTTCNAQVVLEYDISISEEDLFVMMPMILLFLVCQMAGVLVLLLLQIFHT